MAASVMGDAVVSPRCQKEQLVPEMVVDLRTLFRGERTHDIFSFARIA